LKKIYFHRQYNAFSGGHMKVFDYFEHIKLAHAFTPRIYFTADSIMNKQNPWLEYQDCILNHWRPAEADALFLAGDDWDSLPLKERINFPKPVINLIQGFRHAKPGNLVLNYLSCRAIRIFVGEEVANAVRDTGLINGPSFVIPNGIDLDYIRLYSKKRNERDIDLLIVGVKNPHLAGLLAQSCAKLKIRVQCLDMQIPREDLLAIMGNSRVTIFLPLSQEGFYLPALEGMALETLVVCPIFSGNKLLYKDGFNCLMPEYSQDAIFNTIKIALLMPDNILNQLLDHALLSAQSHPLDQERAQFLNILDQIYDIWER
jgi:glycosyltransferase involved in cell wall biosynthesis